MNRHLKRFVVGRFFASIADQFLMFAIPLLVYKQTGNIAYSGLVFAIEWAPRILYLPFAGLLSDRIQAKKLYLLTDGVRATLCLFTWFLLQGNYGNTVVILSIFSACVGICSAQAFIALEATLPRLLKNNELPQAQSTLQASDQLSQILGPALAAFTVGALNSKILIIVAGLGFSVSAINILTLSLISSDIHPVKRKIFEDLAKGFQILKSSVSLQKLVILAALTNLMIGTTLASSAAIVTGTFQQSDYKFGFLNTGSGLLSLFSFLLVPWFMRRYGLITVARYSYFTMICGTALMAFAPNYIVYALGFAVLLGFCGVFNVCMRTERGTIVPKEHLGKTVALTVLLNQAVIPLSGLLVSKFAPIYGAQNVLLAAGICAGLCGTVLLLKMNSIYSQG